MCTSTHSVQPPPPSLAHSNLRAMPHDTAPTPVRHDRARVKPRYPPVGVGERWTGPNHPTQQAEAGNQRRGAGRHPHGRREFLGAAARRRPRPPVGFLRALGGQILARLLPLGSEDGGGRCGCAPAHVVWRPLELGETRKKHGHFCCRDSLARRGQPTPTGRHSIWR